MGKMVVLKPVVWNEKGYLGPSGTTTSGGYAEDHGYGHEEWNGRADWVWEGWKVFHTQAKGKMHDYAEDGNLGIIMTTMINGQFYAVGVGCNVYENNEDDRADIAASLNLLKNGDLLWELPGIQTRKKNKAAFDRHWRDAYQWVNWRCPQSHFIWFDKPIPIIPNEVIPSKPPRQAIVKMHGSYQAIRPDQALAIVDPGLPAGHPILSWLATGNFDEVPNKDVRDAPSPRGKRRKSAATASDPYLRYLMENEVVVTPKHHRLQTAFEKHLQSMEADGIQSNLNCVDLRYIDPAAGLVLVEVKPSELQTVRFAIRAAIGQLLDYRQRADGQARLLIVIGCKPGTPENEELALQNGLGLAWRGKKGFKFRWPS